LQIMSAILQPLNWNDLRYVLAIARTGTLARAAKDLAVDDTTVSRRLARAERALGAKLFLRAADGTLRPTDAGQSAISHAERVEWELGQLRMAVTGADAGGTGSVRLTSVPLIVNRLLVPALPRLLNRNPMLRLELVADSSDLSLTRREADLALRLARPRGNSRNVITRRVGLLPYAVYAPAASSRREAASLPWMTYDEAFAHLPQAQWIKATLAREDAAVVAPITVNDGEALLEAVAGGIGKSLLPCAIADRDARLRKLHRRTAMPPVVRELWLLLHAELRRFARIAVVSDWLASILPRGP
jgi:DNA-binding transcriptional LysR family regulator